MTKHIQLKTLRSRSGYAYAKISRFANYSTNKIEYSFMFYNDHKFFGTHDELRSYALERYDIDIGDMKKCWGY